MLIKVPRQDVPGWCVVCYECKQECWAIFYTLNSRMTHILPPLFNMYKVILRETPCFQQDGATACSTDSMFRTLYYLLLARCCM